MKRVILVVAMFYAIAGCVTSAVAQNLKRSIAVLPFQVKTVKAHSEFYAGMELLMGDVAMSQANIVAKSAVEQLSVALVKTTKFVVIEREQIEKVLKEQALGKSGFVDEKTAPQAGKLLGTQYSIIGSITEMNVSDNVTDAGRMMTARFAMTLKFVNNTTGQISEAEEGKSEATVKYGEKNEDDLLTDAVRAGVEDLVTKIVSYFSSEPFDLGISSVDGQEIYLSLGKDAGMEAGQVLKCVKKGKEIKDPGTGEVLGFKMEEVGTMKVTQVEKKFSIATPVTGCKGMKEGDLARAVVQEKGEP